MNGLNWIESKLRLNTLEIEFYNNRTGRELMGGHPAVGSFFFLYSVAPITFGRNRGTFSL